MVERFFCFLFLQDFTCNSKIFPFPVSTISMSSEDYFFYKYLLEPFWQLHFPTIRTAYLLRFRIYWKIGLDWEILGDCEKLRSMSTDTSDDPIFAQSFPWQTSSYISLMGRRKFRRVRAASKHSSITAFLGICPAERTAKCIDTSISWVSKQN